MTTNALIPESEVQASAIRWLRAQGCLVERRNTGAQTAEYKGKTRFIRFSEKGAADVSFCFPSGVRGELEIKRFGERPTLDQVLWLMKWNGHGYCVAFWVDNMDTLERVYRAVASGQYKVVYSNDPREYTVGKGARKRRVMGPCGDFDLMAR